MTEETKPPKQPSASIEAVTPSAPPASPAPRSKDAEIGGPSGPEPTRYGDWERGGRCSDF